MIPVHIAGVPPGVRIGIFDSSRARGDERAKIVDKEVTGPDRDFVTQVDDSYSNTPVRLVVWSTGFLPKSFETKIDDTGLFRAVEMQPDRVYSGNNRNEHAEGWNSSEEHEAAQMRVQEALRRRLAEIFQKELASAPSGLPSAEGSVGPAIIVHRNEILQHAPALKEAAEEILAKYEIDRPNDEATQNFVARLRVLSTGIDEYILALETEPTEAEAEIAGFSLFQKAVAGIEALEKTETGDRLLRLGTYAALLGIAAIAAPIMTPYMSIPLMTACVFPDETKKAASLFNELGNYAKKIFKTSTSGDDDQ